MDSARETFRDGTLYVVATPIGNLTDLTLRALTALQRADIVLAEDTRVSGQLLSAYGLSKKLVSLREHNEREMAEQVIRWLGEGRCLVQVSDAGTPGISDPGARLAEAVWAAGYRVSPVPGACAAAAAMSAAGVTAPGFLFYGFLPPKSTARRKVLATWQHSEQAVVCYEAPHRIADCVADCVAELGPDRQLVLARELTKTFETFIKAPAAELLARIQADPNQQRGECVLIIDAAPRQDDDETLDPAAERLLAQLVDALPTKQAAAIVADFTGANRKRLYERALELKNAG